MKTVGIITYHRAHNFGAVLQCYALRKVLESLGYHAVVIDYRQPYIERLYESFQWKHVFKNLLRPRWLAGYLLKGLPRIMERARAYSDFRNTYLSCTSKVASANDMPQDIDVYLIGSDQMWGLHCTGDKIDKLYFGVFPRPNTSKLCGYAISATIPSLQTIGKKALSSYVKNFDKLSFRESTICNEVEQITGVSGEVALDPTLLLDGSEWEQLTEPSRIREKYLLTYFLHDRSGDPQFDSKISAYAEKHGYTVKDVFRLALSPNDFLSAVKHAECIITSSFHATVFSLLFKKSFYSLKTANGKDIRYSDLLEKLGIPERVIDVEELSTIKEREINYDDVYQRLCELRTDSITYLEKLYRYP